MPANKNDSNSVNSQFQTLIAPISTEASSEGAFLQVISNLEDLHYEYEVNSFRDHICRVSLICNDHYKIHIGPKHGEKGEQLSMTTWHEYYDPVRNYFAEENYGIAGYYSFHAEFELVHDDWDPEADEDSPRYVDHGESQVGSIECAATDFQELIEDAVRKLSIKFDIDLYPKRIPLKREIV